MKVRDAGAADGAALTRLLAELGYPECGGLLPERLRVFADDAASFVLVAEDAGRVLGLASASVIPLLHEDGSWCRLSALVVTGDSRRAGVGRALVAEVEMRARARGCRYLEVTSGERPEREAAHRFYRALGLEEVSRRYLKAL